MFVVQFITLPKMLLRRLVTLTILFGFNSAIAQTTIHGLVRDAANNESLPYVNIGIKHTAVGCITQKDGSFTIVIPQELKDDSLTFSMVGYRDKAITINKISGNMDIKLEGKITQLGEVSIKSQQLVEKKIGEASYHPLLEFTDGSTNQKDIFEIAQLTHLDTSLSKRTSVTLHISVSRADSGIFRINFYGYYGKYPTTRIIDKNTTQTHAIQKGWLNFDLKPYN